MTVLNKYLQKVKGWMRANKLKLHPAKTEVLLVKDKESTCPVGNFSAPVGAGSKFGGASWPCPLVGGSDFFHGTSCPLTALAGT